MSPGALIAGLFGLLFVLHQDFWWRNEPALVFGILPLSLAYHVGWTLLVAVGWYWVTRCAWPVESAEETPPRRPAVAAAPAERKTSK